MPTEPQNRLPGERPSCLKCGDPHAPEPGAKGLCPFCRDDVYPPIADRGGKWSPLALGGLSLVCDVLLIPSIMAIVRGSRDLREVARRERDGYWSSEHPAVRAGAVWGIVLGALRPVVAVMLLLTMFVGLAQGRRDAPTPVRGPSELDEVLARIVSEDEATRDLAAQHLSELGPAVTVDDVEPLLALAEGTLDHAPAEDRPVLRGRLVAAALHPHLDRSSQRNPVRLERLRDLYPRLDAVGRSAVLAHLGDVASDDAAALLGELAATDDGLDPPPRLPVDALHRYPQLAGAYLPALLGSEAHRSEAIPIAAVVCRLGGREMLQSSREALLAHWEAVGSRPPAGEGWARLDPNVVARARRSADTLVALGCVSGEDVDAILEAARADDDPRVAVAAVEGLLRRGRTVPDATIGRLAADPLSRSRAIDVTTELGGVTRIPIRLRHLEAVAESDAVPWIVERERPVASVRIVGTRAQVREFEDYAVLRVDYAGGEAEYAVVGPYPWSAWARDPEEIEIRAFPADDWSDEDYEALIDNVRDEQQWDDDAGGGGR